MFLVNTQKCLRIFDKVYVSSDSDEILNYADLVGAKCIKRPKELCGDVPNIPVYQHALKKIGSVDGIIAVQACSPNVERNLIVMVKKIMEMGVREVMTVHPIEHQKDYHQHNFKLYGSIWGIETELLRNYPDPYKPKPEVVLVDNSVDIHTPEDYQEALCQQYYL
jgi:CMP-N-acetylneuraminic acid synthetase